MSKANLRFILFFAIAVAISAIVVYLFLKVVTLSMYVLLVLLIAPVVYLVLKLLTSRKNTDADDAEEPPHQE